MNQKKGTYGLDGSPQSYCSDAMLMICSNNDRGFILQDAIPVEAHTYQGPYLGHLDTDCLLRNIEVNYLFESSTY